MFLGLFLIWSDGFIVKSKLFSDDFDLMHEYLFRIFFIFFLDRSNIEWPTYFRKLIFYGFYSFKYHTFDVNKNGILIFSKSKKVWMRKSNYSSVKANTKHLCFWIAALGVNGWLLNIDWQCQKGEKELVKRQTWKIIVSSISFFLSW